MMLETHAGLVECDYGRPQARNLARATQCRRDCVEQIVKIGTPWHDGANMLAYGRARGLDNVLHQIDGKSVEGCWSGNGLPQRQQLVPDEAQPLGLGFGGAMRVLAHASSLQASHLGTRRFASALPDT